MSIKDNLMKLNEEVLELEKHSIANEKVNLIAVTKNHPVEKIKEAISCGVTDIGENRVQELKSKIEILEEDNIEVRYHLIGNLQINKVKYIYNKVSLIQSLDRIKLAREINKRALEDNININCLVQINIGQEESKFGIEYEDAERFIYDLQELNNIKIKGLMAIAPNTPDKNYLRSLFRKMFKLKNKLSEDNYENVNMKYLSMGMSSDYKIAIEEGSNMIRVGTKIFGKREY